MFFPGRTNWERFKNSDLVQKITNTKVWKKSVEINNKVEDFGKWMYDIDKEKELKWYDRALLRVDLTGDAMGAMALTAYASSPETFGAGAVGGFTLDVLGAVFDVPSTIAHAFKGDWKIAGLKGLSILPFVGSAVPVLKVGSKAAKLVEVAGRSRLAEKYAPFADNVYELYSNMTRTMKVPKGFEVLQAKALKKMGFKNKSLDALNRSKGAIYLNKKTKEAVLAFSGTRTDTKAHLIEDMIDNFATGVGALPRNYEKLDVLASDFNKTFSDFAKIVTGHSKGADPASVIGGLEGIKTILFNPKGVNSKFLTKAGVENVKHVEQAVEYFVQHGDILYNARKMVPFYPDTKGIGYAIGAKTILDTPTLTTGAMIGKIVQLLRTGLKNHGDIFKTLSK